MGFVSAGKVSLPAVAGILITVSSFGASAEDYCSLKTLKGTYTYSNQGFREGQPYASSGIMSFDGAGKVRNTYTTSVDRKQLSMKGTYTVEGNCTGTLKFETGTIHHLYLNPTGDSFNYMRASKEAVIASEAKRVSHDLIVK